MIYGTNLTIAYIKLWHRTIPRFTTIYSRLLHLMLLAFEKNNGFQIRNFQDKIMKNRSVKKNFLSVLRRKYSKNSFEKI